MFEPCLRSLHYLCHRCRRHDPNLFVIASPAPGPSRRHLRCLRAAPTAARAPVRKRVWGRGSGLRQNVKPAHNNFPKNGVIVLAHMLPSCKRKKSRSRKQGKWSPIALYTQRTLLTGLEGSRFRDGRESES